MAKPCTYVIFDFETGGLDHFKNPITELAYIIIRGDNFKELARYQSLVKPYDQSLSYDVGAAKATGITKELCERDGRPIQEVYARFEQDVKAARLSPSRAAWPVLVGHNVGFDIGFLQRSAEFCKVKLEKLLDGQHDGYGNFQPRYHDTMKMARQAWQHEEDMNSFTLTKCVERAGLELFEAHRAMADVIPTMDLFIGFSQATRQSPAGDASAREQAVERVRLKI